MKLQLHPAAVAAIYILTQVCFELAKEFNTIGAANLRKYDGYDWLILAISTAATVGLIMKAFIDPTVHNYKNGKENGHAKETNNVGPVGGS